MKNLVTSLIAFLFAVSLVQVSVAQEAKESPLKAATSSAGSARAEPKGEVEAAIEELKKTGEGVLVVTGEESDPGNAIPGGVINGRAIELVQPAYPAMARAANATGKVVVWVLIDKEGKVKAAQVIDGHPLLRAAAVKAAKSSRFTPTLIDNKPVNVSGRIVYTFAKM